jgi:hypothetical protein
MALCITPLYDWSAEAKKGSKFKKVFRRVSKAQKIHSPMLQTNETELRNCHQKNISQKILYRMSRTTISTMSKPWSVNYFRPIGFEEKSD